MSWIMVGVSAAGLVAGGIKAKSDSSNQTAQANTQAAKDRYSTFTGQHSSPIQMSNPWGDVFAGGMTGLQAGAAINTANAQNAWLDRGGNPAATAALTQSNPIAPAYSGTPGGVGALGGAPLVSGPQELQSASNPWGFTSKNYMAPSPNYNPTYGVMQGY